MHDVVLLGEAMVLHAAVQPGPLASVTEFTRHTAGAETNVAVGLARLGLQVAWVSRLGDDAMGHYLHHAFSAEGIDCSQVPLIAGAYTGSMRKGRVDDGSDPPIEYQRQGSAASQMSADDLNLPWLVTARHLHVTGVFAALNANTLAATQTAMRVMRAAGKTISFDPNLRPALWASPEHMRYTINALAAQADWVLPGLAEGEFLTGRGTVEGVAAFYRAQGASRVVIKLGAQGAYYDSAVPSEQCGHVPAYPVAQVVDTVGAGDAFAVGIISALLAGRPLPDAVRRAAWMGARAVQVRGDCEGLPTRAELDAAAL